MSAKYSAFAAHLENLPSDRPLTTQEIFRRFPDLKGDETAIQLLRIELFVRELERNPLLEPSDFLDQYTDVPSELT